MRIFISSLAMLSSMSMARPSENYREDALKRIVARVNNDNIAYSEFAINPEQLARVYRQRYGSTETDEDKNKLEALQLELETARLLHVIEQHIRNDERARMGVIPTKNEIEERCTRDYPLEVRRQLGKKSHEAIVIILRAYERVAIEGDSPDLVYKELLSDQMTIEQWQLRLEHDVNETSIRNMRAILDRSVDEVFDCYALMQQLIVMEREGPALDAEIAKSDPEYREYLRLATENPSSPEVQEKGPMYRQAQRYLWWQKRFAETEIEILDPQYDSVLDALRAGN